MHETLSNIKNALPSRFSFRPRAMIAGALVPDVTDRTHRARSRPVRIPRFCTASDSIGLRFGHWTKVQLRRRAAVFSLQCPKWRPAEVLTFPLGLAAGRQSVSRSSNWLHRERSVHLGSCLDLCPIVMCHTILATA